jgi:hypothetical protein
MNTMSTTLKRTATALIFVVAYVGMALAEQPCLKSAWAAFEKSDYPSAITAAGECIEDFSAKAIKDQHALEASSEKAPLVGAVESAADRKKIFDRWAVNDVATAYFVRGRSAELLFRRSKNVRYKQLAQKSYQAATQLTYGRCWDPQGWFWSPAESAADRISVLVATKSQ